MNNKISVELIQLEENDLSVRERLRKENQLSSGYHIEMEEVHKFNSKRLREIIKEIGFPTISKVGKRASNSAWLIVQHAISEPDFMISSYHLMLKNKEDINLKNLAYLHDRIQYFQGKPQKFGTQLNADGTIFPVENIDRLNEFRLVYNLPLIPQKELNEILTIDKINDLENQNPEYLIWRKMIGWK